VLQASRRRAGVSIDCRQALSALNVRDGKVEPDPCLPAYFWLSGGIAPLAWWLAATSRWRTTSPLRATSDQTCLLQSIQKTKEIELRGNSISSAFGEGTALPSASAATAAKPALATGNRRAPPAISGW